MIKIKTYKDFIVKFHSVRRRDKHPYPQKLKALIHKEHRYLNSTTSFVLDRVENVAILIEFDQFNP